MENRVMKDSGVEWIGTIPDNWKVKPLKYVADIQTGNTPSMKNKNYYSDNGIEWIKTNNLLGTNGVSESEVKLSIEGSKIARIAKAHSTLVSCIGDVGKMGYITYDSAYNQQINAVSFHEGDVYWKYGMYYLSVQKEQHQYYQNGNVLKILNTDNQKRIVMPIPKLKEQQKIAASLDDKVAHIDNIIEDTKKSIENLKAYKQSLITETVTKGLDLNVKMKDSGVKWIGKTPLHWRVSRVKRIFEIKKKIANKLGYDILSVTQKGLKIKDITKNEGQLSANYSKYQIVEKEDFVMNHMDLLTGWVDLSKFEGVTSPDYRVFKSSKPNIVDNQFYRYIFQLAYSNKIFYGLGQGVSNKGRWRLPTDQFLNFQVPIAPIEEQYEIAKFLNEKTSQINLLVEQKNQLIDELESYKKSFIYEYVTGKKEVE